MTRLAGLLLIWSAMSGFWAFADWSSFRAEPGQDVFTVPLAYLAGLLFILALLAAFFDRIFTTEIRLKLAAFLWRIVQRFSRSLTFSEAEEVWIDVGAHWGELTLPAALQNPKLRVYAFEPNLAVIAPSIGVAPNFVVIPSAVSEIDGPVTFRIGSDDQSSSMLSFVKGYSEAKTVSSQTVPSMRLDTFIKLLKIEKVDWLKIDAQGSDLSVVKSAGEELHRVRRITLEVQTGKDGFYEGASTKEEVSEFMLSHGFKLASERKEVKGVYLDLTFEKA